MDGRQTIGLVIMYNKHLNTDFHLSGYLMSKMEFINTILLIQS